MGSASGTPYNHYSYRSTAPAQSNLILNLIITDDFLRSAVQVGGAFSTCLQTVNLGVEGDSSQKSQRMHLFVQTP